MISSLNPAFLLIAGGLLAALLRGRRLVWWSLLITALALLQAITLPHQLHSLPLAGIELDWFRVDRLSYLFGLIFCIAAFLNAIYAFHEKDPLQHAAGLIYAGAAVGAVFSGDLIALLIYWELTAISSVFLIWARRTERAFKAGMRYLLMQVASGVILLAGVVLFVHATGHARFEHIGMEAPGGLFILLAIGIKCAFPFLHTWLADAYPEATGIGTVMLSSFTTKLAVYTLARGFAGTHELIVIGSIMAAFLIYYAIMENDLRRVLSYSLNNQLGFMVVGIGVGTELAVNGVVAHAFCSVLYQALLFMGMGAVLHRVGHCKASHLGGLFKSMPWTMGCCIIGAASISAFPLFSGFISKSMILSALAEEHFFIPWMILLLASAAALYHSGIKVLVTTFLGRDRGLRVEEAPRNMLLAMGITAALCIGLGCWYGPLYAMLPYPVDFHPYTSGHVLTQMQLLLFSALAFSLMMKSKWYPIELPSVNLDVDWFYRKPLWALCRLTYAIAMALVATVDKLMALFRHTLHQAMELTCGPESRLARSQSTSSLAFYAAALLALILMMHFIG